MSSRTRWAVGGLLAIAALILLGFSFCVLAVLHLIARSSVHRFPFPANQPLTEWDAIELTRQALILDGKRSEAMRPVPSGHKDADGRETVFCRKSHGVEEGHVLWWLGRPDCDWEFEVSLHRNGDEVECKVFRPL